MSARRWIRRASIVIAGIAIVATISGAGFEANARKHALQSSGLGSTPQEIADMRLNATQAERLTEAKRRLHDDQAMWSRRGRHEVVAGAGHYIQFDRPDAVIGAAREVVLAARSASGRP